MIYGYARVSTNGQDLAQQLAQLSAARCVKIYREKISGATAERPQLKRAIGALNDGAVLMVTATDQLARNTRDLLNILHAVKEAGAGFRSLAEPMVDTTSQFVEVIIAVLWIAASWERERISYNKCFSENLQADVNVLPLSYDEVIQGKILSIRSSLRRLVEAVRKPDQDPPDDVFRAMLEQSADVICHVENGAFLYVSPSAAQRFGWDPLALVGTDPLNQVHEDDRVVVANMIARLISGQEVSPSSQCRAICGDGSSRWCESTASIRFDDAGGHRAVLVLRDIADRKRIEEELNSMALQDSLTGLANRRAFDQTLDREWKRTIRDSGEMALLMLDLDYFKQFNDYYGHQVGDDCLRAVAACVQEHARRPGDMACRYGGEEIAVILGATGADAALKIAETLCSAIADLAIPHEQSSCSRHVTASIGAATAIARIGGSIRMPESLLQAADHALYKAKAAGRGRVEQALLIAPSGQP